MDLRDTNKTTKPSLLAPLVLFLVSLAYTLAVAPLSLSLAHVLKEEGIYLVCTQASYFEQARLYTDELRSVYGPLYYMLNRPFLYLCGGDLVALRYSAAFFHACSVLLAFLLGRLWRLEPAWCWLLALVQLILGPSMFGGAAYSDYYVFPLVLAWAYFATVTARGLLAGQEGVPVTRTIALPVVALGALANAACFTKAVFGVPAVFCSWMLLTLGTSFWIPALLNLAMHAILGKFQVYPLVIALCAASSLIFLRRLHELWPRQGLSQVFQHMCLLALGACLPVVLFLISDWTGFVRLDLLGYPESVTGWGPLVFPALKWHKIAAAWLAFLVTLAVWYGSERTSAASLAIRRLLVVLIMAGTPLILFTRFNPPGWLSWMPSPFREVLVAGVQYGYFAVALAVAGLPLLYCMRKQPVDRECLPGILAAFFLALLSLLSSYVMSWAQVRFGFTSLALALVLSQCLHLPRLRWLVGGAVAALLASSLVLFQMPYLLSLSQCVQQKKLVFREYFPFDPERYSVRLEASEHRIFSELRTLVTSATEPGEKVSCLELEGLNFLIQRRDEYPYPQIHMGRRPDPADASLAAIVILPPVLRDSAAYEAALAAHRELLGSPGAFRVYGRVRAADR